jgi:hypothetical protein
MALIKVEALAGYLLEEALAQLLRHNGYRLLSTADEDPFALREAGHGLLVRGRGADHQADALGELLMPSPFSLPVRLFVEGKNRGAKVSLAEVRNAHGTISDVNEHYSSQLAGAKSRPQRRYQYRYALFSAKGFKADAQGYALAQQISLIDLGRPSSRSSQRSTARPGRCPRPSGRSRARTTGGGGTTNAPLFCIGLGLLAASFAWSRIRRRRRICQPVFRLRRSAA